jgi:GNAT superfamily N-acetyltransferase
VPGAIWVVHLPDDVDGSPGSRSVVVAGSRHPDGSVFESAALDLEPGEVVVSEAVTVGDQVRRIELGVLARGLAGSLWFAAQPQADAEPPAMVLVAFLTSEHPPGTVVSEQALAAGFTTGAEQVGAIRWWPHNGAIHQVYVQPDYRSHGIGLGLIYAASAYRAARRWPPLQGGGTRTELGERLTEHLPAALRHRVHPLTSLQPPMTPGE